MAEVNFYLKDKSSKEETLIYLFFSFDNMRLKYSTREKTFPKIWKEDKQRVIESKLHPERADLNSLLDKIEALARKEYRQAHIDDINLSPEYLRERLNETLRFGLKKKKGFFAYFEEFIEAKKVHNKHRTIQKYNTVRDSLKEFQKKIQTHITFDTIDIRFYERLLAFYTKDCGLLNNSTGKNIATLKTFLHWATDQGYNQNTKFMKFKVLKHEADIVYLTEKELMKLYNHDFSKNKRLEKVRDAFCFGCFTGLRHSDISMIRKEHIKGENIDLSIFKTREKMSIPLNDFSREILKKYKYNLPSVSNQKTNEYLKELCEIVKLNDRIEITQYRGAEDVKTKEPKYNLISSHTARRTFVTLSLEKGMRPETVMAITGHKSYSTFKKYIKLTDKVKLVEMKSIWSKPSHLKKTA